MGEVATADELAYGMRMFRVGLAGDGWGAVAALNSLMRAFDRVEILSMDKDLTDRARSSDRLLTAFDQFTSPMVVCAGYKPILSARLIESRTVINVHYSLLPKYRGLHSVVWAILNGETEFGVTFHRMNQFVDDGDIIEQHQFRDNSGTSLTIINQCHQIVIDNLGTCILSIEASEAKYHPQDKSKATWVPKRGIDDCLINFDSGCEQLELFFRALVRPYPLPQIQTKSGRFEVTDARIHRRPYVCTNGRVVNIDNEGVWIKINEGFLVAKTLLAGKTEVAADVVLKLGMRLADTCNIGQHR